MRDENRFLLLAVLKNRTEEEQQIINALAKKKMDWGYIAGQLTHHRLSGYFLAGLDEEQKNKLHYELRIALEMIVNVQKQQHKEMLSCILPVLNLFDEYQIKYAALKGLVLNTCLYSAGERRSNDSDILVLERDLDRIDAVLTTEKYWQALYVNQDFKAMTPEEKRRQREQYHDFPYVKRVDSEYMRYHMIDLNIRFDSKDNEITYEIFEYGLVRYQGDGYAVWGLPWATNLAQLCVHFYREGSESFFIDHQTDIMLYKIVDIVNVIRQRPGQMEWPEWIARMKQWNLQKAAYFTFYHIDQLYPQLLPAQVLAALAPEDLLFLEEISVSDKNRTEKRTHSLLQAAFDLYY